MSSNGMMIDYQTRRNKELKAKKEAQEKAQALEKAQNEQLAEAALKQLEIDEEAKKVEHLEEKAKSKRGK